MMQGHMDWLLNSNVFRRVLKRRKVRVYSILFHRSVQAIVEFRIQTVRTLQGVVKYGDNNPVAEAQVVEFASDWKRELRRTTTDSDGRFLLQPIKGRKIYYLQISESRAGMNPLRVPLRLSRWRGKKVLQLLMMSPM